MAGNDGWARQARQVARDRSGRYAAMNTCELCGKPVGEDYWSLLDSGATGIGQVLCGRKSCGKGMTEEQIKAAIIERRGNQP